MYNKNADNVNSTIKNYYICRINYLILKLYLFCFLYLKYQLYNNNNNNCCFSHLFFSQYKYVFSRDYNSNNDLGGSCTCCSKTCKGVLSVIGAFLMQFVIN